MRTNAGRDFSAKVMGDPSSTGTGAYAPACFMAVTEDGSAPAAGDTTLSGEITSGTLVRDTATFAHTNGTATYTLTKVYTSDDTVTLQKMGIFNDDTGGTLVFETLLDAPASLKPGDEVSITETVTL